MNSEKDSEFVELYNLTYDRIFKYVVSRCSNIEDVSDIVQKTYLNFYERIQKKGRIEEPVGYLYKIAKSELKKHYITADRLKRNIPVFSKTGEDEDFAGLEALLTQELPENTNLDTYEIWEYIRSLDTMTVKIFTLYFYHDEKLSDIAKILEVKESTVKNRLYRTIDKMKEKFSLT